MLYVEVIIDQKIAEDGGIVFMIPHKLPTEEFVKKYSAERVEGENNDGIQYQYRFDASINKTVSFVHFDVPQTQYRYRFISLNSKYKIIEKQIGIAGSGNIYINGENNNPVLVDSGMNHAIIGKIFGENEARAIESSSLDFRIFESDCTATTGIYNCSPSERSVKAILDSIAANNPQ